MGLTPIITWQAGIVLAAVLMAATIARLSGFGRTAGIGSSGARLSTPGQSERSLASASMPWPEFAMLIAESFRRRGFSVSHNEPGQQTGGFDFVLKKEDTLFLLQCKHWRTRSVGAKAVRELYASLRTHCANGGYLVTSGTFTPDAHKYALDARIELIDGAGLSTMIFGLTQARNETLAADEPSPAAAAMSFAGHAAPECPQCGEPMFRRTAQRGPAAGTEFWRCTMFPRCRGTRVDWTGERRHAV